MPAAATTSSELRHGGTASVAKAQKPQRAFAMICNLAHMTGGIASPTRVAKLLAAIAIPNTSLDRAHGGIAFLAKEAEPLALTAKMQNLVRKNGGSAPKVVAAPVVTEVF